MKTLRSILLSLPLLTGCASSLPTEAQYVRKAEEVNVLRRQNDRLEETIADLTSKVEMLERTSGQRNASSGGASADRWGGLLAAQNATVMGDVLSEAESRREADEEILEKAKDSTELIAAYEDIREISHDLHQSANETFNRLHETNLEIYSREIEQATTVAHVESMTEIFKRETAYLATERRKLHRVIVATRQDLIASRVAAVGDDKLRAYTEKEEREFDALRELIAEPKLKKTAEGDPTELPSGYNSRDLATYAEGLRKERQRIAQLQLEEKIAELESNLGEGDRKLILEIERLKQRLNGIEREELKPAELTGTIGDKKAYIFAVKLDNGRVDIGDLNKPIGYLTEHEVKYAIEQGYMQQNALSLLEMGAAGLETLSMSEPEDLQRALGYHVVLQPGPLEILARNGKIYANDGSGKTAEKVRNEFKPGVTFYVGVREQMPGPAPVSIQATRQTTILDKMSARDRRAYGELRLNIDRAKKSGVSDDDPYMKALIEQEGTLLSKYK